MTKRDDSAGSGRTGATMGRPRVPAKQRTCVISQRFRLDVIDRIERYQAAEKLRSRSAAVCALLVAGLDHAEAHGWTFTDPGEQRSISFSPPRWIMDRVDAIAQAARRPKSWVIADAVLVGLEVAGW